ncbi:MAG: hypothetical protein OXR72_16850 [Gemmatimonadota bacterium]|nr:hypothetical protein [Gemmatimonadota bacterium]
MNSDEEKIGSMQSAVDMQIIGDNISDIAEFTIDKYEFRNDNTLSSDVREKAAARIEEALWERVNELNLLRKQYLAGLFSLADEKLSEVVDKRE